MTHPDNNSPKEVEPALKECPWCRTERREIHKTEAGFVGLIVHDLGCYLARHEDDRHQVLTPHGVTVWNSRVADSAEAMVPVEYMTDEELRAAVEFHRTEAARYSNEGAKVWRLRVRMNGGTDGDKQRLAELYAYRTTAAASPAVPRDEAAQNGAPE